MSPAVKRIPFPCHVAAVKALLKAIEDGHLLAASVDLRAGGDARIAFELVDPRRDLDLPGAAEELDERWHKPEG